MRAGGISRIVSAAAVHNTLLATRPELLAALYGEWVFRRMELDAQYGTGPLTKMGLDTHARQLHSKWVATAQQTGHCTTWAYGFGEAC